jgi:hypothetical protein
MYAARRLAAAKKINNAPGPTTIAAVVRTMIADAGTRNSGASVKRTNGADERKTKAGDADPVESRPGLFARGSR